MIRRECTDVSRRTSAAVKRAPLRGLAGVCGLFVGLATGCGGEGNQVAGGDGGAQPDGALPAKGADAGADGDPAGEEPRYGDGDPTTYPDSLWSYPEPVIDEVINLSDQGLGDGDLIDDYIDDYWGTGVRLEIEPGAYAFTGDSLHRKDVTDAEIVGLGPRGAVQLALPEDCYPMLFRFAVESPGVVRFKNLTQTGRTSAAAEGAGGEKFRIEARHEDAEVVLEHVSRPDGACDNGSRATGIFAGSAQHVGTLRLLWSRFEGSPDNGAYVDGYAGEGLGRVIVVGGLYRNNNISNIRIGNDGSTIFGARVIVDGETPGNSNNQRGVRIRHPTFEVESSDLVIDETHIHYEAVATGSPLSISSQAIGAGGILRNSRITNHSSQAAIRDGAGIDDAWTLDDVHITGTGDLSSDLSGDLCVGEGCEPADVEVWWGDEL